MTDALVSLLVIGNGIAGLGFLALAGFVLVQARLADVALQWPHRAIIGAALASAVWAALLFAFGLTGSEALFRLSGGADVLRYGGWYFAILSVLLLQKGRMGRPRGELRGVVGLTAVIVIAGLAVQAVYPVEIAGGWYVPRPTLLLGLVLPILALFLLEQLFRNVADDSRWNLKPLALGLVAVCFFDLYMQAQALMFGRLDFQVLSVRGLVHALVIPLFAASVARSRDWFRRIKVSNKIVIHTTMLLVVGGYLLFMAALGYLVRLMGGGWGEAFQITVFFIATVALAVLLFSGAVRAKIRVWIGKHFFRYRYDYREEWLKFTRALSEHDTPGDLAAQIVRELAGMVESPAGCLWIRDAGRGGYVQYARWNMPELAVREPDAAALVQFLADRKWVVNLDEFRRGQAGYEGLRLPDWLAALPSAWLVVPLAVGSELAGFLVLAQARTRVEVNWEVNDLLKTAGAQAAVHLSQMLSAEALLETRKFEAFNRMSAFVVHDLKNIVAQLSLMLRNAERHWDNPEFQKDMLETVEHALGRMRALMTQLQEGGSSQTVTQGVDLAVLLGRVRDMKRKLGREVALEVETGLWVQGDPERLERVLGHLVQNALDATEANQGEVTVRAQGAPGQVRLVIQDTGCGMSEAFVRERLFKPFQTTKSMGMGIGAYESFQYIRELGGEIDVQSSEYVGTQISITLSRL